MVNNTAGNIRVQVVVRTCFRSGKYLGVALLGHMVISAYIFEVMKNFAF